MTYRLSISKAADRDLGSLSRELQERIDRKIQSLARDPRPPGVVQLQGRLAGSWRIRVGNHRVLYEIRDELRLVVIMRVRDRREAYRD